MQSGQVLHCTVDINSAARPLVTTHARRLTQLHPLSRLYVLRVWL